MNVANRIAFQIIILSILSNWVVLYILSRADVGFSWIGTVLGICIATIIPMIFTRTPPRNMVTVKAKDRALFIDDLVKAMDQAGFQACAAFDNRIFFNRSLFFPPQNETVEVKTLEDNEYLLKFPLSAAKAIRKQLEPYVKLRNVEFLKETDKLMEEK